jgi:hypothetical protein
LQSSSTNDYVKLLPAMQLDQYAIQLPHYPWLPSIAPFSGWNAAQPTQSLVWYDAYNDVKHDRESKFKRATLQHAIDAVCGCAVMISAQFGRMGLQSRQEVGQFFSLTRFPRWSLSDCYTNAAGAAKTPKRFPF